MKTHAASLLHLAPLKAMRSFTMRRLMVFVGFCLVGVILGLSDVLVFEQGVVMAVFVLVGFLASLVVEDRRDARFPIVMHAVYTYLDSTGGEGAVEDVSMSGCRIRSTTPTIYAATLRLQVYPPGQTAPIEIQKALVRWTGDGQFGVQFSEIALEHQERLRRLISEFPHHQSSQDSTAAA
jgi:PilZ domain